MIHVSDITTAIDWQEGLLLAPHHFQQQDKRQGELAAYHAAVGDPAHYGVASLVLEEDKLPGGLFSVVELEAIMPDGLAVSHTREQGDLFLQLPPGGGAGTDTPRRGAVEGAGPETQPDGDGTVDGLLTVWLAVRSSSVAASGAGHGRYRSVPARTVDDESGGPEQITIPCKAPRLVLSAGWRPGPSFTSMPLARVRSLDGPFRLADYVPPLLWLERTHDLSMMCASLVGQCREKAMLLSSRVDSLASGGSAQLEARMRIAALVRRLPRLEALLSLDGVRPLPLFLALCDLSGEMIGLDSMGLAESSPVYMHEDLRACFTACRDAIQGVMQRCLATEYVERRFVWERERFVLSGAIPSDFSSGTLYIGVLENAALGRAATHNWFESSRIGSLSFMDGMVARRDTGPERRQVNEDEGLAVPARVGLYEVTVDPAYISAAEPLCIQNDALPLEDRPGAIVLYARAPGGEETHV